MKIALIGGSGFVGTRLLDTIISDYESIVNIDKNSSAFYPDFTIIGDVRNFDSLKKNLINVDVVILLAAEHRDDVSPTSLYYDVNVQGMKNVLAAMDANKVKRIIFTSSVAVYGLNKINPDENHPIDPFNHYGKSKWQAEEVLQQWYKEHSDCNINIIRPTVIFGERNRGNVFNLLKQISSGRFLMVGDGNNKKSMAYVGNIVAFIQFLIDNVLSGYNVYNYVDNPDLTMNELVAHVGFVLRKKIPSIRIPYVLGFLGGLGFDVIAKLTNRKLSISSVRVKKFCATTQFCADKKCSVGFQPPHSLEEGLKNTLEYEFVHSKNDDITFISE